MLFRSTKVLVPIASEPPSLHSSSSFNHDPSPTPAEKTRKGPSRSVSVRIFPPILFGRLALTRIQTNLENWLQYRDEFADEFIRHDAFHLGVEPSPCQMCGASNAAFRCLDCFSCGPFCQSCVIHQHEHNILHKLQVILYLFLWVAHNNPILQKWNGSFFDDVSLFELGVLHQLGHDVGDPCRLPSDPITITLFDISGVHTVRIVYCFCSDRMDPATRHCQLLRIRWFPATWTRPSTAFTFRLLNFLHKLQTQSKVNLYDFYVSLVSITNAAGMKPPMVRFFPSPFYMTNVRDSDTVSI